MRVIQIDPITMRMPAAPMRARPKGVESMGAEVLGVNQSEERGDGDGHPNEDIGREPAFGGEGKDLAAELVPPAHELRECAEDTGERGAELLLGPDRLDAPGEVAATDSCCSVAHRFDEPVSETVVGDDAAELLGQGPIALSRNQLHRLHERGTGLE